MAWLHAPGSGKLVNKWVGEQADKKQVAVDGRFSSGHLGREQKSSLRNGMSRVLCELSAQKVSLKPVVEDLRAAPSKGTGGGSE